MDGIRWLAEDCDTYCLLLARGLDLDTLVARLGGEPGDVMPSVTADEAFALAMDEGAVTRLGTCGAWAFSLEHWSAEGMETGTLERVSLGTECVAVLNSGTPPVWFAHARDGEVIEFFEPVEARDALERSEPGETLWGRVAEGLVAAGVPDLTATGSAETALLSLVERHCEVDLPRVSMDRDPHPALLLT
ncbi:DUF6461 domain-containing protein [Streptomyces sp. CC77]|uniref:DUF6461 domain-containing protein n=1 Tax=Streptomyces sp. CC77 TaxID=1906739 RepID=UPI0008DE791F|nr:DUF6461 domain-containing protein [Streptomyces sp. CC77]OII66600.1 hypothetical protein BJP39_08290 [Streptomyces sp. CC77]